MADFSFLFYDSCKHAVPPVFITPDIFIRISSPIWQISVYFSSTAQTAVQLHTYRVFPATPPNSFGAIKACTSFTIQLAVHCHLTYLLLQEDAVNASVSKICYISFLGLSDSFVETVNGFNSHGM